MKNTLKNNHNYTPNKHKHSSLHVQFAMEANCFHSIGNRYAFFLYYLKLIRGEAPSKPRVFELFFTS
jgi:hypothetical protein